MNGKQMMKRVIVLTYMGLLVALQVILSRFFSINAWNFKIGFSFLPIAVAGMFFGPFGGAAGRRYSRCRRACRRPDACA